jgi:hypothetical protein
MSVLRQDHPLALYCYDPVEGVPPGVEVRDAAEVLPRETIIRHVGGSVALFANRFRYQLQKLGAGTWIDCDTYLLAPIDGDRPYLFGEEEPGRIANGILRIPGDAPLLAPLLRLFDERVIPYWLPRRARLEAAWRLLSTGRTDLARMPWGTAGPAALTALARRHGVAGHALEPDVFYPVHWSNAAWILDPAKKVEDMVTPKSVSLHLFNELIKGFKDKPAPKGSFLSRVQAEGAID